MSLHTSQLHQGRGWDPGADTAKENLLSGKVLGGDSGDGGSKAPAAKVD